MQPAVLSKNGKGKARLDYIENGGKRTMLWERVRDGVIETVFDGNGIVVKELFHKSGDSAEVFADTFMKEKGIPKSERGQYSEVKIGKNCPGCGEDSLVRIAESAEDSTKVPITPLYKCSKCGKRSYYLSGEYLDYLVVNNRALFSEQELKELDSDKEKFMTELKEYIIRIFASQKIMRIR